MSAIELIAAGILILILLPIAVIDARERRIPNWLNAVLALAGLGFLATTAPTSMAVLRGLIAPIAIVALFLGLIGVMKLLRRPGTLGLGDVKFLAASSLWIGFVGSTLLFVIASLLLVAVTVGGARWRKLDLKAAIPFGPFLAVSLAVIFLSTALTPPA